MRRLACALLLAVFPIRAVAQDVVVRSGEHGDFTRLVLSVPEGTGYEVIEQPEAGIVRVALSRAGLSFDTSTIFNKINTNRISAVTPVPGESAIDISLNCPCGADSFTLRGTMIVVDLSEREGATMPAPTNQPDPAPEVVRRLPTASELSLARELSTVRVDGLPSIGPDRSPEPLLPSVGILRPQTNRLDQDPKDQRDSDPYALGDTIAERLARAATEGLLDPALAAKPDVANLSLRPVSTPEPTGETSDAVSDLARQLTGLEATGTKKGVVSIGATECTPDRELTVSDWTDVETVNEVLAGGHAELFGEFDVVNERAVRNYARELIYFGFGAEARAAMQALPDGTDSALQAISYLVDGEVDPTRWFESQADCDGYAAFWSALSGGLRVENTHYNAGGILRGLENLPEHLRDFLGPIVAQKLSTSGKTDLARDVLRRLERLHGGPTDSLTLGEAQIAFREGKIDEAQEALQSISALSERDAPSAITTSVDIAHARQEPVSEGVVELTAAYASELRDSDQGPDLWKAHLRTLLLNDHFAQSFQTLAEGDFVPREMQKDMAIEVVAAVTERADNLAFLKYVMSDALDTTRLDSPELELSIISRLIDLGMPDMALDRIERRPDLAPEREFRLARAKALLALSRPEEAEIFLVGLRGENIDILRAEARRRMGDYSYARELYDGMGETEQALSSAWLSGDWERVSQEADTPLGQAARLLEADTPAPERPSLNYAEELSSDAAETRETLRALLEATRIGSGG
ncbi:hypothetical protein ACN2XU_22650 [Primorskyibacter sp. 2E107]|uniref:hypothetical protein n=1 Tax=Primorskyibacter sp. 2E107 TaxID=3403458 RepID=UPI003AF897ED